jgi:hypothetical protein
VLYKIQLQAEVCGQLPAPNAVPRYLFRRALAGPHSQSRRAAEGTVVGRSLCVRRPLEINGKGIRGAGGVACKEARTIHTINITCQQQYFVARCLGSYVGNVFGLHFICLCPSEAPLKRRSISIKLHSTTSQKTIIFMPAVLKT